ncbi:MAG: SLC13 family permease [Candidatus Delongbacteria bacterium]
MEHNTVFAVLILTLGLFVWGKIRHDLVALSALFLLVILRVVDPASSFEGFGHPAVITVAAVLIIGKGLEFSGLVDLIGKWVSKVGDNFILQVSVLSLIVAVASAFMNNVGALAIMMPVAIQMAKKTKNSPSKILMPIAFASLLGGMMTLIGTPPNIIISSFRAEEQGTPFGMFDFMPVGLFVMLGGVAFVSLIGWRILPKRAGGKSDQELFDVDDYMTEAVAEKDCKIIGKSIKEIYELSEAEIQILGLIRSNKRIHAPSRNEIILENDGLIIESDADELKIFINDTKLKLVGDKKLRTDAEGSKNVHIAEAVITSNSRLPGRKVKDIRLRSRYGINLLAIARKDSRISQKLDSVTLKTGDVLLLQGLESSLNDVINLLGCLPLASRGLRIGYQTKIPLALGIFILSILAVVFGFLPVQVSFSIAAFLMVLSGIIPLREIYESVDWPVIVLLGAMIPVGAALESSGGAQIIADSVYSLRESVPGWGLLAIVLVATMFLSDLINNAATVVLMAPVAIGIANSTGYSIDPFLMAVAIGGSSAFLTPIGHQSNTLVMAPGGYKFSDYWKMGLPLEVIIVAVGMPLILFFWPL